MEWNANAEKEKAGGDMASPYRCAIFGQHPMCFPWGFDEEDDRCRAMKLELLQRIMVLRQQGVTQFLVACDCGIGLYAAEQINILREHDPDLMLFCVTPYEEQATKWAPYLRERYFEMLTKCTYMTCIAPHAQPDSQLLAYRSILDEADMALTVFDTSAAHRQNSEDRAFIYASEKQKPIWNLEPFVQ